MTLDTGSSGAPGEASGEAVRLAAAILRRGGIVAFPTETDYGLGATALAARAVARLFEATGRPRFDPLIVHIAEPAQLELLAERIPDAARRLAERFWPGPLTLVLPKLATVPDIVTSGLDTVGVRVPDHPLARALIREAGTPVAAPSANLFGQTSPVTAEHVRGQLGDRVDAVLDGGPCRVGIESTIVSFGEGERPRVLRLGGVAVEDLEAVIGPVDIGRPTSSPGAEERPLAPGDLPRHYAPARTPLVLAERNAPAPAGKRVGLLSLKGRGDTGGFAQVEVLSSLGDLREAAAALYAALRRLDASGLDLIVAELAPEEGLGRAINDRLRRAAGSPLEAEVGPVP